MNDNQGDSLPQLPHVDDAFAPSMTAFKRGRDFAAWLGLVPRQHSGGGNRLGRTSKMGQPRKMLKHLLHHARINFQGVDFPDKSTRVRYTYSWLRPLRTSFQDQ